MPFPREETTPPVMKMYLAIKKIPNVVKVRREDFTIHFRGQWKAGIWKKQGEGRYPFPGAMESRNLEKTRRGAKGGGESVVEKPEHGKKPSEETECLISRRLFFRFASFRGDCTIRMLNIGKGKYPISNKECPNFKATPAEATRRHSRLTGKHRTDMPVREQPFRPGRNAGK